ncbi:hypothetical protein, partial [Bacillus sp. SIMBA_033]|uniref:hypothetical protein n=1 Tax=Bacillus sp. SIMBA_033 TaxID=3085776 RepID=UPI00397A920C
MSEHEHHDHDHDHAPIVLAEMPGYYDVMTTAFQELMIEKGHFSADELRRQIEVLDSRNPALG